LLETRVLRETIAIIGTAAVNEMADASQDVLA
jgi:hypothetical protein